MSDTTKKALKLLEALAEEHEVIQDDGDHDWRECRACLAREELDNPHARELLRHLHAAMPDLLAALKALRGRAWMDLADPEDVDEVTQATAAIEKAEGR